MKWYPPLNWINYVDTELYEDSYTIIDQYITMFYNAVLILGMNEIGPVNNVEILYVCVTLVGGIFMNSLVFSDIARLIAIVDSKQTIYQERLNSLNSVMISI